MRLTNTKLVGICGEDAAKRTSLMFDCVTILADWERGLQIHEELTATKPDYLSIAALQHEKYPTKSVELTDKLLWEFAIRSSGRGFECVPIYSSEELFDSQFQVKEHAAYRILLENIPLADDQSLSWLQVSETRKSPELLQRFVHLRMWLRTLGAGVSSDEFRDELESRIQKYREALKANGIKTLNSSFSLFVDPAKFATLATVSAGLAVTTNPVVAAFAAGSMVLSNTCVKLTEHLVGRNQIRSDFAEIALLEDLGKAAQK